MPDWREWFSAMKKVSPDVTGLPTDVGTQFWEEMYDAFRARLESEYGLVPVGAAKAGGVIENGYGLGNYGARYAVAEPETCGCDVCTRCGKKVER